jgi:GT2 family glycosyltransferase
MKLSIVIVNFNVRYFLEQALHSVYNAITDIESEIFVVDNASSDDSVHMLRSKFPGVKLIANSENTGFSVANNQAIRQATGEYILLLNPDTLVEEDTFRKCLEFLDKRQSIGGLGVKMIDGSGVFLPESKRGFPSPSVAFYKTFGLSKLFPKSKVFNQYHLGYLDENKNWEVDVLAGAFMLLRKSVLDKIGLLDERFFMYGEDIDLSYRIQKAGYQNYYFSDTTIIHYKGESTKKGDLNYVKTFYNAMILFAKKHFKGSLAGVFIIFLNLAIYFRAGLTIFKNIFKRGHYVLFDILVIFFGIAIIKDFWANYFYADPSYFKPSLLRFNAPLYTSIWILSLFFSGVYDKPFELKRLFRGLFIGLLIIASVYGFLNVEYRSSRAIILLTTVWTLFFTGAYRYLHFFLKYKSLNILDGLSTKVIIVGSVDESSKVRKVLDNVHVKKNIIGIVSIDKQDAEEASVIDTIDNLEEIVQIFDVNEIIFCAKDIPSQKIIDWMAVLGSRIDFKILPQESLSIIGSSSKENPGELYTVDVRFNITDDVAKRNKRLVDLFFACIFILLLPLMLIIVKERINFVKNIYRVLLARLTWVGYNKSPSKSLPKLKKGVIANDQSFIGKDLTESSKYKLNFIYAKDYHIGKDIKLIVENLQNMGNT